LSDYNGAHAVTLRSARHFSEPSTAITRIFPMTGGKKIHAAVFPKSFYDLQNSKNGDSS
jgi:hypothetical protein